MTGERSPADALRAHVEVLAGSIGERNLWRYQGLVRASEYIQSEFTRSGYEPALQTYEISRLPVSNIEVTRPGDGSNPEIVIVGAHYDTVENCPGANDNGSGVASMLELARRFARRSVSRTIRFVAFVNEEPPFFQTGQMGSAVYAGAARARGDRIAAMLSLETMGYFSDERGSQQYPGPIAMLFPDVGNFIGLVANLSSARLLRRVKRGFKKGTDLPVEGAALPAAIPGVGWSDHKSFWEAGYQALMVTDTAPFRYPYYHTAEDTPDKISYEKLAQVTDGLEHAIEELVR